MDSKSIYLACPNEKSQPRKHLVYCLSKCSRRCDRFLALPEQTILRVIEKDAGQHDLHYDQLKLFPMKPGKTKL